MKTKMSSDCYGIDDNVVCHTAAVGVIQRRFNHHLPSIEIVVDDVIALKCIQGILFWGFHS